MSNQDLLSHDIIFCTPQHLSDISSWHYHIPFAFFLMEASQPKVFVELGTHKGDSYCAFCQAVVELRLATTCCAIDTWKGDEHAGYYDENVSDQLRDYHDTHYGCFSRLVRSTFDEARSHFADGSIDLLHIDGLHTYEAVKHDFECWLPKMSERGVILFHDTIVRDHGFGVWQVWGELRSQYPSREFRFGHGLGVLAVGGKQTTKLNSFFGVSVEEWSRLEAAFLALGNRCFLLGQEDFHRRAITERDAAVAERDAALSANDAAVAERDLALSARISRRLRFCIEKLRSQAGWQ